MAKIAYVEKENLPENLQAAYDGLQQKFGVVPNVIKAMANAPELLSGFMPTIQQTTLPPLCRYRPFQEI